MSQQQKYKDKIILTGYAKRLLKEKGSILCSNPVASWEFSKQLYLVINLPPINVARANIIAANPKLIE